MITLPILFLPHTHTGKSGGQIHGFSLVRNLVFTIRSSNEWKVMMLNLPSGFKRRIIVSIEFSSTSSSWFNSIRIAWNVRLAGWPPVARTFAGIAAFMISESSPVVSTGFSALAFTMCFAMFLAKLSSRNP